MPTILNFHILKKYPIIFFKFPNKYVSGSHIVNLASQIVYGVKSNLGWWIVHKIPFILKCEENKSLL